MTYVKIHYDFWETASELTDDQAGRLFKSILRYAANGTPPTLEGPERLVFLMLKAQIDRDRASYVRRAEANRENASKGGRPSKNPLGNLETHSVLMKPIQSHSLQEKEEEEEEKEEEEQEQEQELSNTAATASRPDFDTIEAYASNNLSVLTAGNMQELESFKQDLPEELIRHAIDEAGANAARKWSYVRAILNRYIDRGFKTLGDVIIDEQQREGERNGRQNDLIGGASTAGSWEALDPERRKLFEEAYSSIGNET